MIYTMLKHVPEGMPKAMFRLKLQQKIIQMKYNYQAQSLHQQSPPPLMITFSRFCHLLTKVDIQTPCHGLLLLLRLILTIIAIKM